MTNILSDTQTFALSDKLFYNENTLIKIHFNKKLISLFNWLTGVEMMTTIVIISHSEDIAKGTKDLLNKWQMT